MLVGFGNFAFANEYSDSLAVIETNLGNLAIEFFPNNAPKHVENFIELSQSGFYDGTLFHRIMPGFMIQGGDPNTIDGNENTWGKGGPDEKLDAEFNSIKHDRGIVSMARSTEVNSAGSQFFIVHKDSNFLDGKYTVFGRIITDESFETLDKIAVVQTGTADRPINPEQVRIIKISIINIENKEIPSKKMVWNGSSWDKMSIIESLTGSQIFESKELGVVFSVPEGWALQQFPKSSPNTPDVVATDPNKNIDGITAHISLTINDAKGKTIDDLITKKNNFLAEAVYLKQLEILSQEKIKENVYQTEAIAIYKINDNLIQYKIRDVLILSQEKSYNFAYGNSIDNFNNEISRFNDSLDSFKILSQESSIMTSENKSEEKGGGCLIATAAYGSEMAPQVQLLREIRDNQLMNTESGKSFMSTFNDVYYTFSPTIADMERESPLFKEVVKLGLTPMLSSLAIMENAESESDVLGLGLSVIALNLGMYLGLPAIVIIGIKKRK
jgi:peptidyl-prolyl cis-trans isomerase B (cyclophilin B)